MDSVPAPPLAVPPVAVPSVAARRGVLAPAALLAMQRAAGNSAVVGVLQRLGHSGNIPTGGGWRTRPDPAARPVSVQRSWRVNPEREEARWEPDAYTRKMPVYPPWGYQLVDKEAGDQADWRSIEVPQPGQNVIHWPFDEQPQHRNAVEKSDNGPTFDSYLRVGDTIVTIFGGVGQITEITTGGIRHGTAAIREKLVLDQALSSDGRSHSAKGGVWAYVRRSPRPSGTPVAANTNGAPSSIALGFADLYFSHGAGGGNRRFSPDLQSGSSKIPALKLFGLAAGAAPYWDWGNHNPESPSCPISGTLIERITAVMRLASEIHFSLDGFVRNSRAGIRDIHTLLEDHRAGKGVPHTADELVVVLNDPSLLARTHFYLKGTRLDLEGSKRYLGPDHPGSQTGTGTGVT